MSIHRAARGTRAGPVTGGGGSMSIDAAGQAPVVVLVGAAALVARPWLAAAATHPTTALVGVFVALGAAGAWWPLAGRDRAGGRVTLPARSTAAGVAAVGCGAFVTGRLLAQGRAAAPALATYLVLNTLAAVAEEAFFRRLLYGLLEPYGPAVAVGGSAAAFAVVHLTVWGAWALPLDLAAGLVLSWQRWASGRWSVPALTHVVANVLAVI